MPPDWSSLNHSTMVSDNLSKIKPFHITSQPLSSNPALTVALNTVELPFTLQVKPKLLNMNYSSLNNVAPCLPLQPHLSPLIPSNSMLQLDCISVLLWQKPNLWRCSLPGVSSLLLTWPMPTYFFMSHFLWKAFPIPSNLGQSLNTSHQFLNFFWNPFSILTSTNLP